MARDRDGVPQADCPFCRIGRGQDASALVVASDPDWMAFFPETPATPGHTLIVPRAHVAHFWQLDERLAGVLAVAALRVGNAIEAALEPQGMNLITSNGAAAEQTVMHVHLHVVPRWEDDPVDQIWPEREPTNSAVLARVADQVRALVSAS